jgi:hypothetical protein
VAYNFQIGNNKIKLLTEYESVTQKVLLSLESILQNAKQLHHAQFYFTVSSLKITGHGNTHNNVESLCTIMYHTIPHNARFGLNYTCTDVAKPTHITDCIYCTNGCKNILQYIPFNSYIGSTHKTNLPVLRLRCFINSPCCLPYSFTVQHVIE